jgi:pyruvate-ferredoxin/flavodoxin oxidoreductase
VLQSSQASASHLIAGVIRGLRSRRPAVFSIYTPCPVEHGLPDDWAPHSARLALESRAFPYLVYDPDAGASFADCLSLEGNPALDEQWPTYTLEYEEAGETRTMELPLTIADWAATEARFRKHFKEVPQEKWTADMLPFGEYMALPAEERDAHQPFVYAVRPQEKTLRRLSVSPEIALLAEDRLLFWNQLRELAGLNVPASVRDGIASSMEAEYEARVAALRQEFEAKLAELKTNYPKVVARRMAEGLIRFGGTRTVSELVTQAGAAGLEPLGADVLAGIADLGVPVTPSAANGDHGGGTAVLTAPAAAPALVAAAEAAPAAAGTAPDDADDDLAMEAWIEKERCTTCNECTNINSKMFVYDENKQAYIRDVRAGTFAQLVMAAEKCPAGLIHPGTPVNPKEKDLAKWIERAKPFN